MSEPVPPIYVVEGCDVGIYHSIDEAELSIEEWWVEDGEGFVCDANGSVFKLTVARQGIFKAEMVPDPPNRKPELERALREYLKYKGEIVKDCSFGELVALSKKYIKTISDKSLISILFAPIVNRIRRMFR